MGIGRFDTTFTVQSKTSVRQPGGGSIDTYTDRFTLCGQFIEKNTRKILESGAFVDITYSSITYRYETDKAIGISDIVLINGVSYAPVGNCTPDSNDHPRFYTQTLTLHG